MNHSERYQTSTHRHSEFPDRTVVTLTSPRGITARFVPDAGMVGESLKLGNRELLGQRHGLGAYLREGKTFGIPLLAPWANRLVAREWEGTVVEPQASSAVHLDENGLPIHGTLAGAREFVIDSCNADDSSGASVTASIDFTAERDDFVAFPFAHRLTVAVSLRERSLTVRTTVQSLGDHDVPVAFGWHPYFAIPGAARSTWKLRQPFSEHAELDARCVPTGKVRAAEPSVVELGDPQRGGVTFDDLYVGVPEGTQGWLEGADLRVTMGYESGYNYGVLFAPADQDLVAIEPMTAPTDPFAGHFPIHRARPGEPYSAVFSITVDSSSDAA